MIRKFGVRAAMPGFIALELCPELVLIPPNFEKYRYVSGLVQNILRKYDANFDMMSLDEAHLDITSYLQESGCSKTTIVQVCRLVSSPHRPFFQQMRQEIYEQTGLTASAGIAANRMLAKICSDKNKPNGTHVMIRLYSTSTHIGQYELGFTRNEIMDFVQALSVRKVPGIGKVTERILQALGITTLRHVVRFVFHRFIHDY